MSYKTIERLYSDEEATLVLYNLFLLLLDEVGVSGHAAGDGTGYLLQAGKHCRSAPEKQERSYRYIFHLVDLETGLDVAYGYSDVSQKAASRKAIMFIEREGLALNSVRLDRDYSYRKNLRELSESYFAADKDRFGQQLRQRWENRRELAGFWGAVLRNLFSVRVRTANSVPTPGRSLSII